MSRDGLEAVRRYGCRAKGLCIIHRLSGLEATRARSLLCDMNSAVFGARAALETRIVSMGPSCPGKLLCDPIVGPSGAKAPRVVGTPSLTIYPGKVPVFMSYDLEIAKQRVGRVFRYLAEMHRVRTPPIVSLEDREWFLPLDGLPRSAYVHTDYSFGRTGDPQAEDEPRGGVILKVGRPRESECPEPSVVIKNWLKPGWDRVDADPDSIVKGRLKGQLFADPTRS